jgi:hypothetical protein
MKRVHVLMLLLLATSQLRSQVTFSVSTDKTVYRNADSVHVILVATNNGPTADTLFFASSLQASYFIDSFDFSQQFYWTQSPTMRVIPPRETITWNFANPGQSVPPVEVGVHAVIGQVVGHWTSDTLWITVSALTGTSGPGDKLRKFVLEYNYPNPFNPTTTITYALPSRSQVTLSVFNTLGQQVATLVNEIEDTGYHDVRFDASGLASGIYFYRLIAGEYVATKKLVVLR